MSQINVNNIKNRAGTGAPTLGNGVVVTGVVTATTGAFSGNVSIGGTLTYEDVTNIDAVGIVTARTGIEVTAGGVNVTAGGINVTAGISTLTGNAVIGIDQVSGNPGTTVGVTTIRGHHVNSDSDYAQLYLSNSKSAGGGTAPTASIRAGRESNNNGTNLSFYTNGTGSAGDGSERLIIDSSGNVIIGASSADSFKFKVTNGAGLLGRFTDGTSQTLDIRQAVGGIELQNPNNGFVSIKGSSTERVRFTSTGGVHFNNAELIERANIVANKLSAAPTINLDNGMIHHFTTTETTTATPNITSTAGINTNMAVGDAMSVTIVTTAAAAGYAATVTIDHLNAGNNGGSLNWTGGSAPSDGGSSGVDIYAYTLIKTADAKFTVLATQTKTS